MTHSSIRRSVAAAAVVVLAAVSASAADPEGVLWEQTSQMSMEGVSMSMPQTTLQVCTSKEWKAPPQGADDTCKVSDFKRDGNKLTWTMQCTGQMPMKGNGELTFLGDDAYTGVVKATAEGMSMTIRLSGRKIGTCDKPVY